MTKFVLECLRLYYAGLIEYVIVFDMPFLFNGNFSVSEIHKQISIFLIQNKKQFGK